MQFVRNGKVMFRHPLVSGQDGQKLPICKGILKLSGSEQQAVDDDLVWLHAIRPKSRAEAKGRDIHPKSAAWWFEPLEAQEKDRDLKEKAKKKFRLVAPTAETHKEALLEEPEYKLNIEERLQVSEWKRAAAEKRQKEAEKKATELEKAMAEMGQKFGRAELKKGGVTLAACLVHFEAHVSCSSEDAKGALMPRIKKVVDVLGPTRAHSSVILRDIHTAVENSGADLSKNELRVRRYSIKRFFGELSRPVSSNGLGLPNPAEGLKVGSVLKIQSEKRRKGEVTMLNPEDLLKNKKLRDYWKAAIAVMAYGGLRLVEAASLEWSRAGEKDGDLIEVRPTEFYPETKTLQSERDIPPFPNVWKYLNKHRAKKRHERLVFDRVGEHGPTWFRTYRGKAKAEAFSLALTKAIGRGMGMEYELKDGTTIKVKSWSRRKVDGVDTLFLRLWNDESIQIPRADVVGWERHSVALQLRHFWETSMKKVGRSDLIDATGGHSKKLGDAYYTVNRELVEKWAGKIPKL